MGMLVIRKLYNYYFVFIPCTPCVFFFFFLMIRPPPRSTLFPSTTLFRSKRGSPRSPRRERTFRNPGHSLEASRRRRAEGCAATRHVAARSAAIGREGVMSVARSEEHTSELQSPCNLVCRLLLEKKNKLHD